MFFEGGGYKSRAGCHGARTVHTVSVSDLTFLENNPLSKINHTTSNEYGQTSKKCRQLEK